MLKLRKKDYSEPQEQIEKYLYDIIFAPLLELTKEKIYNSRSALVSAIRTGRITYQGGEWSGSFTGRISRELLKFASFDGRSRKWKGIPPPDILAATTVANTKRKELLGQAELLLADLENTVDNTIGLLSFNIEDTLFNFNNQLRRDTPGISVFPEITETAAERLNEDYTNNQRLTIAGWIPEETARLRGMVQDAVMKGYSRTEFIDRVMKEWGVARNKAKFWARQETSLFLSKMRRERYKNVGVTRYQWITANDERVRPDSPAAVRSGADHRHLHGTIQTFGDPPAVNLKTGKRAEPGEDYNCRCIARPIVD